MAAIVTPLGCLSRARTASCLVPPRVEPEAMFPGLAGFFALSAARWRFVLLGALRCDILGSFRLRRHGAVTAEAPQWRHRQRGQDPGLGQTALISHDDTDARFAAEVQSFLRGKKACDRPST